MIRVTNHTTVALSYLLIVLFVAASSARWVAIITSIVAMLTLNFFFLPPVGTFTIADPQNWIALVAFLAVSQVASRLSAFARAREREALNRRNEVVRLFDLSRDILLTTEPGSEAIAILARHISSRFSFDYVSICLPTANEFERFEAGALDLGHLLTTEDSSKRLPTRPRTIRTDDIHGSIGVWSDAERAAEIHLVPLGSARGAGRPRPRQDGRSRPTRSTRSGRRRPCDRTPHSLPRGTPAGRLGPA